MVVEVLHIHCAGGTLPTLGGRFLVVTIFSLLRADRLGVLTIWGDVTELLARIFMAALLFSSREREAKNNRRGFVSQNSRATDGRKRRTRQSGNIRVSETLS